MFSLTGVLREVSNRPVEKIKKLRPGLTGLISFPTNRVKIENISLLNYHSLSLEFHKACVYILFNFLRTLVVGKTEKENETLRQSKI